ncbi:MAG: hypothetical protein J6K52_04845 [Clostridia bacterium]|nr:hypothetical protein [Clostridia bacterium]
MFVFSSNETKELEKFLFKSYYIHDAEIVKTTNQNDSVSMKFYTPYFKNFFEIIFENVNLFCSLNELKLGTNEAVLSLTVGFDNSDFGTKYKPKEKELSFLIEKFSGRKIYIICEKIIFKGKTGYEDCLEDSEDRGTGDCLE